MKKRVALGLSGGVDSAVSAKLLQDQGWEVTAVYLECYREAGCRADGDRQDALKVALQLQIPFISLDLREQYQKQVLNYFYQSYQKGQTPNPDVLCNREIKFGLFDEWARAQGFEMMATGHYARIKDGRLYTAKDKIKDQTYFLSLVPAEKFQHVLFPIGDLCKSEVREKAREFNLVVADKKDSTGVCFVGEVAMRDFLGPKVTSQAGKVMKKNKETGKLEVVGRHKGAELYTVGQRHGFTITEKASDLPQYYVTEKRMAGNILIVGEKKDCERKSFLIANEQAWEEKEIWVRLRHQGEILRGKISPTQNGQNWQVTLEKPAFAICAGQFAVFYEQDPQDQENFFCAGGAEIL